MLLLRIFCILNDLVYLRRFFMFLLNWWILLVFPTTSIHQSLMRNTFRCHGGIFRVVHNLLQGSCTIFLLWLSLDRVSVLPCLLTQILYRLCWFVVILPLP